MKKAELLKKVGSMQQVAHVRPIEFTEGRAKGISGYDVKNGDLRFQVFSDKCLDLGDFSYKGINLSFIAKQGLIGRMDYDTHGIEGIRSLMGGMLFTCGLENTCLPCEIDGKYYPMHGRLRSTPAEHVRANAEWVDDKYTLSMAGKMREAELFGKNLTMSRTIETIYGEKSIRIIDQVTNAGFTPEPMMILYHFNLGYPLLDEGALVILPTKGAVPRDKEAEKNQELWNRMEAPEIGAPERCYTHDLAADADGNTFACLVNPELKLGVKISFNKKHLPKFGQWKSIAASDYVMGLEPMNAGFFGRAAEGENLHVMQPFATEINEFVLSIIEGDAEIAEVQKQAEQLITQ